MTHYYDHPDDDSPQIRLLWQRNRRASRDHQADCGCVIKKGEVYSSVGYIDDFGKFVYLKLKPAFHFIECKGVG